MSATTDHSPVIRGNDEGEQRWFAGGGVLRWLATFEETGGDFLLFEADMSGGKTTPLHSHPSAESLFVLEGEIVMHVDGVDRTLAAGGFALAPEGVPHAFKVVSDTARVLFLHTPGPAVCQAFYWEASDPIVEGVVQDQVDMARVRGAAESTGGMTLLGPPPFVG